MWKLLLVAVFVNNTLSQDCRTLFHQSYEDEKACTALTEKTKTINENSTALLMGYKGAGFMMQSRYKKGAVTKLSLFNTGKSWLEKGIKKDNNSLELRYIRFCFQSTVPAILHYDDELAGDKKIILDKTPFCSDSDLKMKIRTFLLKSDKVTDTEKATIKTKWTK